MLRRIISGMLTCVIVASILITSAFAATSNYTLEELKTRKKQAHEMAEIARSLGYPEDSGTIKEAQATWWEAHNAIKSGKYKNPEPDRSKYTKYYTDNDAIMMAKVTFCEARGISNKVELACVMWTILNRVDAGYGSIYATITAPNQFAYRSSARTTTDTGVDLLKLAYDVLERWNREKNGETDVGRVLPKNYLWYSGDGRHNYFRNRYNGGTRWNYSLPSPYQ